MTGTVPMEGDALPPISEEMRAVEDRLIEAMITCWRQPDREAGWLRLRSWWPDVQREVAAGDYDARGADAGSSDVAIRPPALTRLENAEMEEALGWVDVLDPLDRRIVALATTQLGRGRRVNWRRMLGQLGVRYGADGLRVRYRRALAALVDAKNGGNPRADASRP